MPPLRNPPPDLRDSFALGGANESDCASGRQDPKTRTLGGAPTARNSPLCFRPKSLFPCWVKKNRGLLPNGQLTAMAALRRHCGSMANCDLTAHWPFCPLAKGRADKGIGSLRKVPWVLSLSGVLWAPFCHHGQKGAEKELTDKPKFEFHSNRNTFFPNPLA